MKKGSIKVLLTGFVLCTSMSVIGCESADFEEPVEEETRLEEATKEKEEHKKVERKETKKETKKEKTETKKNDPVEERKQSLIKWTLANVNSKAEVRPTDDYPYPDCSANVYLNGTFIGVSYYYSRNDVYEFTDYDAGGDTYISDPQSPNADASDENNYDIRCENCGKPFVGSQTGYCEECATEILGDAPDLLE